METIDRAYYSNCVATFSHTQGAGCTQAGEGIGFALDGVSANSIMDVRHLKTTFGWRVITISEALELLCFL